MLTKPLFGLLSDRMGRRLWLLIGTLIFAGVPFLYGLIETPAQLIAIRLLHGTATAIYGPVTVAYVAERSGRKKAERLGWFGMARSGGYVVGPAVAGWLLLTLEPVAVFTLIGALSMAAFVPVLALGREEKRPRQVTPPRRQPRGERAGGRGILAAGTVRQFVQGHAVLVGAPAVWLSGALEGAVFVVTYVIKAFLPVYALTAGYSTVEIGLFFTVQEGALLLLKPWGGRLGDRLGHLRAVSLGMICLALCLPFLQTATGVVGLLAIAAAMGAAQALIFPATVALIAEQAPPGKVGAGMGLAGSLKNAGKVAGPLLGGPAHRCAGLRRNVLVAGRRLADRRAGSVHSRPFCRFRAGADDAENRVIAAKLLDLRLANWREDDQCKFDCQRRGADQKSRPQSDRLAQPATDERADGRRAEKYKAPGCGYPPQQPHRRDRLAQADLIDKVERTAHTAQRQRRPHSHDRAATLIGAGQQQTPRDPQQLAQNKRPAHLQNPRRPG